MYIDFKVVKKSKVECADPILTQVLHVVL